MGVTWGIVESPARYNTTTEELVEEWREFVEANLYGRRTLAIMNGDDRLTFRRVRDEDGTLHLVTTVEPDPRTRARIDRLSQGDGTYDLFDRLIDGYDVFAPYAFNPRFTTESGTSWFVGHLDYLIGSTRDITDREGDPDVVRLAKDLCAAARLAKRHKMLIRVHY
ncbi:hypothetical protein [Spirillospora albida]|uniref:hypothetical protein n=1 Tax=Spirillospora albida TaxID=58123 RepID=UPI0004BE52D3|nr:hypothetical protein [Spirillospora albida]